MRCMILILLAAGLWGAMPAADAALDVTFQSNYIWRGLKNDDGPVFQPGVTVLLGDFTLGAWGNMPLTDQENGGDAFRFNRGDFSISYDRQWGRVLLSGGAALYVFSQQEFDTTAEVFAGIMVDAPLSPMVTLYQDVAETRGTYLLLGGSHTIGLGAPDITDGLEISAGLGFGSSDFKRGYFRGNPDREPGPPAAGGSGGGVLGDPRAKNGPGDGGVNGGGSGGGMPADDAAWGLTDFSVRLSLPIKLPKGTISGHIQYVRLADEDIRSPRFEEDDDYVSFGMTYLLIF
ncbi:MAG: hypothetical protein JXQ27_07625 [Acidobacteria bacterium]|nr:hypothetical protein [Acidobacteriota bacterium]